ncbi:transcriptional regulatory protein AfsQ1 [Abditibacteriota bacterium]|nr:transcriptional regulatory protein AfsQ1 [Abditibacteriota bacterium]
MAQILLVDDDTNVLLTLAIALRRQGHTVTVAQNGWQALSLLRREDFAFLISDVKMPGMSGIELAQRAHTLPHVPLVILTSALDVEIAEGIAEHFLPKPVDVGHLHDVLVHDAHLIKEKQHVA